MMDETLPSGLLIEILIIQREKKCSPFTWNKIGLNMIEHIINNEKNLLQIFFSKFYIGSVVGQNLF